MEVRWAPCAGGGDGVYDYFVDWDHLDLRVLATAPAENAGGANQAPPDDVMGYLRDARPDIGAYERSCAIALRLPVGLTPVRRCVSAAAA